MIYDLSFMPGPDDYIALIVIMIIILKLLVFAVEHGSSLLAWDKNSENYHHLHHQHHCHLDFPPGPIFSPLIMIMIMMIMRMIMMMMMIISRVGDWCATWLRA